MKITHHGGNCCGIKHLVELYVDPNNNIPGKQETPKQGLSADRNGRTVHSDFNLHWPSRPEETYEERFTAYLEFLSRIRPFGLVECSIVVPTPGQETLFRLYSDSLSEIELGLSTYEEESSEEDNLVGGDSFDQSKWIPVFEANGFKLVTEFPNVNSGNTVQIWHLVMKNDWKPANKKENV